MRHEAIYNTHSTVTHIFSENEAYDKDDKLVNIDESKVATEVIRLQSAYDAQEYSRKREAEYPTIAELTIALYDASDKEALVAKRNAVKLKYPKPS
mgnify:CR=1 FL=1|tara:strand:+ start:585 stop:872 length:288 start_codon:yes stop_codon:yes gene_type:complete